MFTLFSYRICFCVFVLSRNYAAAHKYTQNEATPAPQKQFQSKLHTRKLADTNVLKTRSRKLTTAARKLAETFPKLSAENQNSSRKYRATRGRSPKHFVELPWKQCYFIAHLSLGILGVGKLFLATRICRKKNEVLASPWCRNLCFHVFFLLMFPKPNFLHAFREHVAAWAAIRPRCL